MAKNWFQNIKNNDAISVDYNNLNNHYKIFNFTGRKDANKIQNLKTRIDNLYNNLNRLDDTARDNAESILDQLMGELTEYLNKDMKPKLIKRKGNQFGYRGIKGLDFEFVKENGLIADWDYNGAEGFEKALFFTDNTQEASRYGETILRFPWPTVSVRASVDGINGKYYITNENISPDNIQYLDSTINKWEKITNIKGN